MLAGRGSLLQRVESRLAALESSHEDGDASGDRLLRWLLDVSKHAPGESTGDGGARASSLAPGSSLRSAGPAERGPEALSPGAQREVSGAGRSTP